MCLEIAKTAKRRVAKRDMIVYKSGLKKHKFIKDGVIGCITPYRTSTYIFGRKIKSKLKVDRFKLLQASNTIIVKGLKNNLCHK